MRLFSLLIPCLLLVVACSKQKKYEKMIEGEKIIESYTVDGADSLTWLVDSVLQCPDYFIRFHSQNSKERESGIDVVDTSGCVFQSGGYIGGGSWYLKNKRSEFTLNVTLDGWIIFPTDWNVVNIEASQLSLETNSGNKTYELKFVPR